MTRLPCCQDETLGTIFRDGVRMALNETTIVRKVVTLGVVCVVSACTLVILGCERVTEKMDGGK